MIKEENKIITQKNNPLISIIIPVYNVEKYLNECIESILNQEFKDYEIILVDDGSKDSSGKICDEYSKKYSFISVIHKSNGGLSDARNFGIKVAKGEYILFVDSDDYIGKNSLNKIISELNNHSTPIDVMFLEAFKFYSNGVIKSLGDGYVSSMINHQSKEVIMQHLSGLPKFPGSACTKLVSNKLIQENNLYFEKGLLSEDIDWTIKLLVSAKKFAYSDVAYYYYRQNRKGSISNSISDKGVESLLYIIKKWASKDLNKENQEEINAFLAYEYMIALYIYNYSNYNNKMKYIRELKKYIWILDYGKTKKIKLVKFLSKIFSINTVSILLKLGYKFYSKNI